MIIKNPPSTSLLKTYFCKSKAYRMLLSAELLADWLNLDLSPNKCY